MSKYRLPDNFIQIPMSLAVIRENAARLIFDEYKIDVRGDMFLEKPYKLCDIRILYPELFKEIGAKHGAKEEDFVGWGDCDVIYGRFDEFLNFDENYHIIGGFHGHFTAVRNIESFRKLYRSVPDLVRLITDERPQLVDEVAFRTPLLDFLARNQYTMFYINRYFCDIVPECFFGLFRSDHATRNRNFFDAYNPDKNIDTIYCRPDGGLVVKYDNGDSRKSIYCHLQKRSMSLDFDRGELGYYIGEDKFSLHPPVKLNNDNMLIA